MYDKAALNNQPELGTCCIKESTKNSFQAREYIYNLLAQQTSPLNNQKRLPKIHRKDPPPLPDAVPKAAHKTMGPPTHPHAELTEPPQKLPFKLKHWRNPYFEKNCMKKHIKEASKAFEKLKLEQPTGRIKDACCAGVRPPIPVIQKHPGPVQFERFPSRTNWIERNAIRAITEKPGYRVPNSGKKMIVDTSKGDKQALVSSKTHSGLEKRYVYKPAYGKVPEYLKRRAEAISATREQYSHYLNERALQKTDYMLTEAERTELLNGLKTAWDKYNAKYLALSASSINGKQLGYKVYLENQLTSLEKDIEMVETHSYIFVDADKRPGVGAAAVANDAPVMAMI